MKGGPETLFNLVSGPLFLAEEGGCGPSLWGTEGQRHQRIAGIHFLIKLHRKFPPEAEKGAVFRRSWWDT